MADGEGEGEVKLLRTLEVHFAVWKDDLGELSRLLREGKHDLETRDPKGYTPLLLAYALGHQRAALMLIAAGAYAKSRMPSPHRWETFHVASLTKNPHVLRTAVMAMLQETDAAWQRRVPIIQDRLGKLPDFSMELTWEFSSWIPLVGTLLPRDTMKIRKRGSSLRIEYTLLGMEGFSWGRGDLAFVIRGDSDPPGAVFVLDNEEKTAGDARLAFTDPQDYQVQDWVRKTLTKEQKVSDWWSRSVEFVREHECGWLGEELDTFLAEDVGEYVSCSAFTMKHVRLMEWSHPALLSSLPPESWWREEYTQAWRRRHRKGLGGGEGGGGEGDGGESEEGDGASETPSAEMIATAAAATYGTDAAPEEGAQMLMDALKALSEGRFDASGEMVDAGDEGVQSRGGLPTVVKRKFSEHFEGKTEGWVDPADEEENNRGKKGAVHVHGVVHEDTHGDKKTGEGRKASETSGGGGDGDDGAGGGGGGEIEGEGGDDERDIGVFKADHIKESTKTMDFRVNFTKEFPLSIHQILPVIECVSRTGRHFANFQRFFETKLPKDKGFPVRFTIPVFPFVTAVVTFGHCTLESPPEELFVVPDDYAMGKYVERGFIRQL